MATSSHHPEGDRAQAGDWKRSVLLTLLTLGMPPSVRGEIARSLQGAGGERDAPTREEKVGIAVAALVWLTTVVVVVAIILFVAL
jgi:hypothetical protein